MCIFTFFKKQLSKKVLVKKEYHGDMVSYTFPTDNGDVTIWVIGGESSIVGKYVVYERLGEQCPIRASEENFVKDVFQIVRLVSNGHTNVEVMDALLGSRVFITDSDVLKYISELYLVLVAMNRNCNKDNLLQRMKRYAENNYRIIDPLAEFEKIRK